MAVPARDSQGWSGQSPRGGAHLNGALAPEVYWEFVLSTGEGFLLSCFLRQVLPCGSGFLSVSQRPHHVAGRRSFFPSHVPAGGATVKNPPANAGDTGSIPGSGRSPGEEMATHASILAWKSPMDGGAWRATVHGIAESWTRLNTDTHIHHRPSPRVVILYPNGARGGNLLDSKEIKPVNPKGDQPLIFIGKTDAEAEAPILWPPDMKSQLTGRDPDAGKD